MGRAKFRVGARVGLVAAVLAVAVALAAPADITTVAGGFIGDGGPATSASLHSSWDVTVDASGNLFIADSAHYGIRRVDAATGTITTVAGSDSSWFSGDGGPAADAQLRGPFGVALDASGNLFIADIANSRVRWVDAPPGSSPPSRAMAPLASPATAARPPARASSGPGAWLRGMVVR